RYGHGDDQRAARAAEKQHKDDDHQTDAFEQRVPDLAYGRGDEIAAVENGDDVDIVRFELLAQLLHLGVNAGNDFRHIRLLEPHDDTLDGRRVLIQAKDPFRFLVGIAQGAEVADQDRHAVGLRHDDIAEVLEGTHESDAADDKALIAARHPTT